MGNAHRLRRGGDIQLGKNRSHAFLQIGMNAARVTVLIQALETTMPEASNHP